jgi:ribonuclease P protein component
VKTLGLYKKEKLCSTTAIDRLFGRSGGTNSALSYPLRAVWMTDNVRRSDSPVAFLVSIPKRRIRRAVDRVQMRRRVREAYRLKHHDYAMPEGQRIDVAFIYVADKPLPYANVERAMCRLLNAIATSFTDRETPTTNNEAVQPD